MADSKGFVSAEEGMESAEYWLGYYGAPVKEED